MADAADVIELGSSDEEPETSIRKIPKNKSKPIIQSNARSLQIPIQVKNVTNIRNSFSGLPKTLPKTTGPLIKGLGPHHINPMSVLRSPITVNGGGMRSLSPGTIVNQRIPINGQNAKNSMAQSKSCLTKLPPGITVTRTGGQKVKRKHLENPINNLVIKRQKLDKKSKKAINPMCQLGTVETGRNKSDIRLENDTPIVLDDDDQGSNEIVEEPMTEEVLDEDELSDTIAPIENIVIEDSPVKPPVMNKLAQRTAAIEEIVIEDSPLKETISDVNRPKTPDVTKSKSKTNEISEPHSKKKLEFTKTDIKSDDDVKLKDDLEKKDIKPKDDDDKKDIKSKDGVEKEGDIVKDNDEEKKADEKVKEDKVEKLDNKDKLTASAVEAKAALKIDDDLEFHPSYQRFINLCLEMDKTSDMKKIVEKKVICYYKSVDKSFTSSQMFVDLVDEKVATMKVHPNNLYLYIKDVVDELRVQRKSGKSAQSSGTKGASTSGAKGVGASLWDAEKEKEKGAQKTSEPSEDEEEAGPSSNRKVRKLEKALRKLNRAIQKLEEQEVDFDEEGDSAYLLADNAANCALELAEMGGDVVRERDWKERYKARLVRVYSKLSRLTGAPGEKREHVRLEPRAGHPPGPARRLQAWLRRRPALAGAPLPFPDFHDVVQCVREANRKDGLGWNESQIMEEARDLFVRVGRKLQRRRQEREWRSVADLLPPATDPAEGNIELRIQLERNAKLGGRRVKEVIDRYAERQTMLRLEPQDVDDKEADKSENSGEDERDDEPSVQPSTSDNNDDITVSKDKADISEVKNLLAEDGNASDKIEKFNGTDNKNEKVALDEASKKENDVKNEEKKKEILHDKKDSEGEEKFQETVIKERTQEAAVEEKVQKNSVTTLIQVNEKVEIANVEIIQESAEEMIQDESVEEIIEDKVVEQNIQKDTTKKVLQENSIEEVIQEEANVNENIPEEVTGEIIQDSGEEGIREDAEEIPEVIQEDSNEGVIQDSIVEENLNKEGATGRNIQKKVAEKNIQEDINETEQQITVPVSDTDESNQILSSDNDADKIIDDADEVMDVIEDRKETNMKEIGNISSTDVVMKIADYENQIPVPVSDSEESNRILSSSDNDVNFVEKSEASQNVESVVKNDTMLLNSKDKQEVVSTKVVNGQSNSESGVEVITSDRVESDIDELHLLKLVSGGRTDNSGLSDSSVLACGSSQYSQNSQTSQNEDTVMDVDESDAPSNGEEEIINLDKKALLEIDGDTEEDTDGGRDSDVVITCFNLASTEDECDDYVSQKIGEKTDGKDNAADAGKEDSGSIENIDSVESVTSEVVLLN